MPFFVTNCLLLLDDSNDALQEPYVGGSTLLFAYLSAITAISSSTNWAARAREVSADIRLDLETRNIAQWTKKFRRAAFSTGKRLCICENGWNMAQPDTQPGDLICVISGVEIPLLFAGQIRLIASHLLATLTSMRLMQGEILMKGEDNDFKHICLV